MRLILCCVVIAVALSGCATTQNPGVGAIYTQCPPLKTYSKAQRERAARELRNLAAGSDLAVLISDYGKLREACRIVNNAVR